MVGWPMNNILNVNVVVNSLYVCCEEDIIVGFVGSCFVLTALIFI